MKRVLAVLTVFLSLAAVARAEVNIVDSLEWMAVDAPLIVKGKAVGHEDAKGPGSLVYRDVSVEVAEVVKGKLDGQTVMVRLRSVGPSKTGEDWKESGHSYLFFLTRGRADDDRNVADRWVLRSEQGVIDLDKPERVYTADMKKADDGKGILATVKKYAATKAPREAGAANVFTPQRGFLRFEVPPDAEIWGELWGGSMVFIHVPAEEKYKERVLSLTRSESAFDRSLAAEMLRNYPGEDTVKRLTELLDDPGESRVYQDGKLIKITHYVRAAAYAVLVELGEKPPKPVFEREPTAAERAGDK